MIDGKHALSISRQAQLAGISRGSVYYLPRPVNFSVQKLMRRIDPLHLEHPFMGARMLRDLAINRANQVWALDTTFIPIAKGFVYLTAVVDWASRRVLAAKVAITLEAYHAVDVLQEAFSRHGRPEIVNTDQDSQFTAHEFVQAIKDR